MPFAALEVRVMLSRMWEENRTVPCSLYPAISWYRYSVPWKPYPSWALPNNSAEIRRVKGRIAELTKKQETAYAGWEFDGGTVEMNREDNRLQIFFEEKPDEQTRETLKENGFRWSPKAGAWQRQLNDNAIYAADRLSCIKPLSGKKTTNKGLEV